MAERDQGLDEQRDDVPVPQSRIPTKAAPAGALPVLESSAPAVDDPMASIRPLLPESGPLLDPTVELTGLAEGSALEYDPTIQPSSNRPGRVDDDELEPFTVSVDEPTGATLPRGERRIRAQYQLLTQIGTGGMGEVWKARQASLGRPVALKRLRKDKKAPPTVRRQFESEARLTGILDHPNIVTVYDLSRDRDGRVFYTMKLIEGTPWSDLIAARERGEDSEESEPELKSTRPIKRRARMGLRDHLDILLEVSQAIAFAHSRGVIHRDIKPGNVMIGDYGEVLVVDWGLALAIEPLEELGGAQTWTLASPLPRSALICGTPAYMAPETANADRTRIGLVTDVYLLGGVLFHLLYGRPPHKGKTVKAVIRKAKENAWVFPDKISGRLKPWDALLRPVIMRALASDPTLRYPDAGEFGDDLRKAIRNYESAKVASREQEKLTSLDSREMSADGGYQRLAAMIARLEGALESWPRNLTARQTLAHARLELASLALANGDLALTKINLDAFDKLPPLPDPEADPEASGRRLTFHPVDGTLVGAPRPTDSLVAAGTSNEWVSSADNLGARSRSDEFARTVGALELAAARTRNADGARARLSRDSGTSGPSSIASVEIQQGSDERLFDEEQQLAIRARRLRDGITERESSIRKRRLALRAVAGLVATLLTVVIVSVVLGRAAIQDQRDHARGERDKLSKVVLDDTADSVAAQLDVLVAPVHGALLTAVRWAEVGALDSDDPRDLNAYFMAVLDGTQGATSMLRADTSGHEYMLLSRPGGWRTRTTVPGQPLELRDWTGDGELIEVWREDRAYDPHARPWYMRGEALREQARRARLDGAPLPVAWTDPYEFFTTKDIGVSVSAPATSVSGREFVIAFDVKLGDLSRITRTLPEGIERGQVFVFDEQQRVLGLPRELGDQPQPQLLLTPMAELDQAPICQAAYLAWREQDEVGPFRLELGDKDQNSYWVGVREVQRSDRPEVWIAVVVPETYLL